MKQREEAERGRRGRRQRRETERGGRGEKAKRGEKEPRQTTGKGKARTLEKRRKYHGKTDQKKGGQRFTPL